MAGVDVLQQPADCSIFAAFQQLLTDSYNQKLSNVMRKLPPFAVAYLGKEGTMGDPPFA